MKLKKFEYYYILDNVMSRNTNSTSLPPTAVIIFAYFFVPYDLQKKCKKMKLEITKVKLKKILKNHPPPPQLQHQMK